jgi:hypothetical protein
LDHAWNLDDDFDFINIHPSRVAIGRSAAYTLGARLMERSAPSYFTLSVRWQLPSHTRTLPPMKSGTEVGAYAIVEQLGAALVHGS